MGQIDQLLRRVAGAPVRTVRRWRSRGISWKVITSNLLPVPSLSIIHHQLLPSRAGNDPHAMQWVSRHQSQTFFTDTRTFPAYSWSKSVSTSTLKYAIEVCICSVHSCAELGTIQPFLFLLDIEHTELKRPFLTTDHHDYHKVNRCLARYSPRATTTNRPTNRALNKPAWSGPN